MQIWLHRQSNIQTKNNIIIPGHYLYQVSIAILTLIHLECKPDNYCWQPRLLDTKEATFDFRTLTTKELRPLLFEVRNQYNPFASLGKAEDQVIAFGINSPNADKEPIGLLLAKINHNTCEEDLQWKSALSVLSLAVKKPWRMKGIASSLLQASLQFARNHCVSVCTIDQPIATESGRVLEHLLSTAKGWKSISELVLVTIDANKPEFLNLQQRFQLVSKRQQQQFKWKVEQYPSILPCDLEARLLDPNLPNWARPIDLSKVPGREQVLPRHCKILRVKNGIAGWLISYHAGKDLMRYGKVWVDPLWQKRGGLFALIADTIQSAHLPQIDEDTTVTISQNKYKRGCFCFSPENIAMKIFSENHFRAVSTRWVETTQKIYQLNI